MILTSWACRFSTFLVVVCFVRKAQIDMLVINIVTGTPSMLKFKRSYFRQLTTNNLRNLCPFWFTTHNILLASPRKWARLVYFCTFTHFEMEVRIEFSIGVGNSWFTIWKKDKNISLWWGCNSSSRTKSRSCRAYIYRTWTTVRAARLTWALGQVFLIFSSTVTFTQVAYHVGI